jgi:hypothetical protein
MTDKAVDFIHNCSMFLFELDNLFNSDVSFVQAV